VLGGGPQSHPPGPPLARPVTRLGATLVDGVVFIPIVAIVFARSGVTSSSANSVSASVYNSSLLVVYSVELAYQWLLVGLLGQTLGDMAVGVRVLRQADLGVPGLLRAAQRVAVIAAAGLVPVIGPLLVILCYLWMLWDPLRQGLHDKLARTVVVDLRPARRGRPVR
jgi:uncharacterized RDD family membrane protein YckC